jgi:hypothetical protein
MLSDFDVMSGTTSQHVMSLIEGDALYPLFSNAELPIDFASAGIVPDSPNKFQQIKKGTTNVCNTQNMAEEPLFSIFLSNGGEKGDFPLDLGLGISKGGFLRGLTGSDDSLMQTGVVPDARKMDVGLSDISRQYGMSIVPSVTESHVDLSIVPQVSKGNNSRRGSDDNGARGRKRKFIQAPTMKADSAQQMMTASPDGQPLSPEDERNMKRQRRLVKNREAAQLFRQRQKAYIQDLEKKVADLAATNNEFRARVELLNSENKLIKEQLLYLRNFITQAVSFSFPKVGSVAGVPTATSAGMPNAVGGVGSLASMAGVSIGAIPSVSGVANVPNVAIANMSTMGIVPSVSVGSMTSSPNGTTAPQASPSVTIPSSGSSTPNIQQASLMVNPVTPSNQNSILPPPSNQPTEISNEKPVTRGVTTRSRK